MAPLVSFTFIIVHSLLVSSEQQIKTNKLKQSSIGLSFHMILKNQQALDSELQNYTKYCLQIVVTHNGYKKKIG